jgi:murein DD-endopeptidase MepM/ murein hydrolase activator NlpD
VIDKHNYFILHWFYDIIQNVRMYKFFFTVSVVCALVLCACDLQPKITSIPDSIGAFIEDRYPALLADPNSQPEIYNSAVTDYGVYASPELYGSANIDDYVLYASVNDYVLVPESEQNTEQDYLIIPLYGGNSRIEQIEQNKITDNTIVVTKGDTVYSLARKNGMTVSEFAQLNDLHEPYTLSIGQKLKTQSVANIKQETPKVITKEKVVSEETVKPTGTTRVDLQEITVQKGDTLYSLSRKYEIPVNDLAVMNKLSSPFNLAVGQKIKVPKLNNVKTVSVSEIKTEKAVVTTKMTAKTPTKTAVKTPDKTPVKTSTKTPVKTQTRTPTNTTANKIVTVETKQKISSDPQKKLPKVAARSSSKFSWPVRGKILSAYGAKNNGLFNDGINIAAAQGTVVKAAENGVVAYAGNEVKGMGNLIIIQHSDGWMTIYAHLSSMAVKRGTRVSVGTQIGRVGKTGKVDQPQLHFEIRKGTKAYNPTQYLKK